MGWNPFSGEGLVDIATLGTSRLLGENTMSKIPGLNAIGGYTSDADKRLLAKQEQMAAEAKKQQERNAQARLQALGQSMLAFNPRNQMMAQMFGPEAAFSPQQFAQMGSDPGAKPVAEAQQAWTQAAMANPIDPKTRSRTSGAMPPEVQAELERSYENERRKRELMAGMQPVGPGPAPLGPRPAPQQARRF